MDNTCTPPKTCKVTGTFIDQENFINFPVVMGDMDDFGHFVFTGPSVGSFSGIPLTADGNFNAANLSGSGNFMHTGAGGCTGTMTLTR